MTTYQRLFRALFTMAMWVLASGGIAATPRPDKYVTDNAHVLTPDMAHSINEKLVAFEQSTSNQILVYIDTSLNGNDLESFTTELMHQWKVGQKGNDNGAVFFAYIADRKMRICTGYGLEGALPDALCKTILEEVRPKFKLKQYDAGVSAAVESIIKASKGEYTKGAHSSGTGILIILLILGGGGFLIVVIKIIYKKVMHCNQTTSNGKKCNLRRGHAGAHKHTDESHHSSGGSSYSPSDSGSSFLGGVVGGLFDGGSSGGSSDSGFSGGGGDLGGGGASSDW